MKIISATTEIIFICFLLDEGLKKYIFNMFKYIESPSLFSYVDGKSTKKEGYRKELSLKSCKEELGDELILIFKTFQKGINIGVDKCSEPPAKCRGYDAVTINSWILTEFAKAFPGSVIKGRYGRQFINIHGYLICVKKLNNKGMPMNIGTGFSESILKQKKSDLLNNPIDGQSNPILVLGYMVDKFGSICGYSLSYIKGSKLWSINASEIVFNKYSIATRPATETGDNVKLKNDILANKAN